MLLIKSGSSELALWRSLPRTIIYGGAVDLHDPDTHSFIVKIRIEQALEQQGRPTWRGQITHVPSGVRRYLKNLDCIKDFILPFLQESGVEVDKGGRLTRWLKHWNIHPRKQS